MTVECYSANNTKILLKYTARQTDFNNYSRDKQLSSSELFAWLKGQSQAAHNVLHFLVFYRRKGVKVPFFCETVLFNTAYIYIIYCMYMYRITTFHSIPWLNS